MSKLALVFVINILSYSTSFAKGEGGETINRILPEDSKQQEGVYYKDEMSRARKAADRANSLASESEKKLLSYEEELKRLQSENDELKSAKNESSPTQIADKLAAPVKGIARKSKQKQRVTGGRKKIQYLTSGKDHEPTTVLPAGSWVRAKILTGVQANSKYAYNVLMQLDYAYSGPNKTKIPLNGCLIIGGATADLSIERVIISPHTLSCVRDSSEYIQRKIQGFVAGRDSSNGVMGVYDSKQSKVFLAAVLSGVVKGASAAYEISNTTTTVVTDSMGTQTPVTNFTGNFKDLALAKGIGTPAEMVTSWYLRQATSLLPTIHVGSGQNIWIIMTDSVEVPDINAWEY